MLVPILYLKLCKAPHKSTEYEEITKPPIAYDDEPSRKMEHIGEVMKNKFEINPLIKTILILFAAGLFIMIPAVSSASTLYTNENIHYVYHEAPATFDFLENGEVVGATVSGIPFRQRNIANMYGIDLQRFEIGLAYWYVSDRGVIWAENDLVALSIYISRIA
jgi:hypothetical protein